MILMVAITFVASNSSAGRTFPSNSPSRQTASNHWYDPTVTRAFTSPSHTDIVPERRNQIPSRRDQMIERWDNRVPQRPTTGKQTISVTALVDAHRNRVSQGVRFFSH